jgi:hypothetical protein
VSGPHKDQAVAGPASAVSPDGTSTTVLAQPGPDRPWLSNTKANSEVAAREGERATEPEDDLGVLGNLAVETVSLTLFGPGIRQRMLAAALRGFLAESARLGTPDQAAARARAFLKELLVPANAARFAGGYLGGTVAGTVSPVTDLLGLGVLAEHLPLIAHSLPAWAADLAADAQDLAVRTAMLNVQAVQQLAALLRDPGQLHQFLETVGPEAVTAAGAAGRRAALAFAAPAEEEAPPEPPDSFRRVLTSVTAEELTGWYTLTSSKAERLRKLVFSTPWSDLGYRIGRAVAMVAVTLLMFAYSAGIGNVITAISGFLGRIAPALARGLLIVGRLVTAAENLIGLAITKVVQFVKPLKVIVTPIAALLERLAIFLRRLLGIGTKGGGRLAAKAGSMAADEAAARAAAAEAVAVVPTKRPRLTVAQIRAMKERGEQVLSFRSFNQDVVANQAINAQQLTNPMAPPDRVHFGEGFRGFDYGDHVLIIERDKLPTLYPQRRAPGEWYTTSVIGETEGYWATIADIEEALKKP